MEITFTTDSTKAVNWVQGGSATGIAYVPFVIASNISTISDVNVTSVNGYQIIMFLEGIRIPNDDDISLARNIIAEVTYSNDGVVIRDGDLDEDGYGNTLDEASVDFLTSLYDRYMSLLNRKSKLAFIDADILERLEVVLGQNQ